MKNRGAAEFTFLSVDKKSQVIHWCTPDKLLEIDFMQLALTSDIVAGCSIARYITSMKVKVSLSSKTNPPAMPRSPHIRMARWPKTPGE